MEKEHPEKQPVPYYGKKVYYINPIIANKDRDGKKEPEYWYEDIEDSES